MENIAGPFGIKQAHQPWKQSQKTWSDEAQ